MSSRVLSIVLPVFVLLGAWPMAARADVKAGLVGYWPLDGDATDGSASRNDGTLVGNVRAVPDRYSASSAALLFPGEAGAFVDLGDPAELQITGAMTLTAWVYLNGSNQNNGCIIGRRDSSEGGSWDLSVEADADGVANAVTFGVARGSADYIAVGDVLPVPTDQWVHIAAIYRPGLALEIYIGGQLRASNVVEIPASQLSESGTPVLIGSRSGCSDCGWDGLIDEVRVYNRAVTQIEVWQIMRANVGCSLAPEPADGATDVPRDVTLHWTAGLFAKTHDVYFGTIVEDVNNASRTSPGSVLVGRGRSLTTYAPTSDLEFGQTYYWRVDEVNAFESAIYKGNVWSFTVEPYASAIANVVATTNVLSIDGSGPANTVNGSGLNEDDEHSTSLNDMWVGVSDGSEPVWLQYGFDALYKLNEMLVWNYNAPSESGDGFGPRDVTVEYSADGAIWATLRDVELAQATGMPDYVGNTSVNLGGIAARYVRLTFQTGWGATGQYGLSEVRFFHVPTRARAPQPADGESGVDVDLVLSWSAGREAEVHDVHLSNSAPMVATGVALQGSVTTNQYPLRPLDFGTTYYWRVDELNEARSPSLWQGEIWTFTTCEYAKVDDFEGYSDDSGRRIYQTWKDGYENGSGAMVGYMEAPFAEKHIVHGGGQSMPFTYNNADSPFYSEAGRSLGTGKDWQDHGADALRLFVRGNVDNDPGSLYVAVEDTVGRVAVATHPDPTILTSTTWQEWAISYSELEGISLSGVQRMSIGVGDRDNPVPGGSGLIYIDDIEFGHPVGGQTPVRR